jgi:biopolymer transport protein ExbD
MRESGSSFPSGVVPETLTKPLGLNRYQKSSKPAFPLLAIVDFCAIGCLFFVFSSSFIFSPGLPMDLPGGHESVTKGLPSMGVLTVLSGGGADKVLFEGRIFALEDVRFTYELETFAQKHGSATSTLLVKLDQVTSMRTFFHICGIARKAGIGRVHIAGDRS